MKPGGQVAVGNKYRYLLWRGEPDAVQCGIVMLNPSTGNGVDNDNTLGRLDGFVKDWGYSAYAVANLYAYRTPYPEALWYSGAGDIIGPQCNAYLRAIATLPLVVVAWGAKGEKSRIREVLHILREPGRPLFCLGTTQDGSPRHPLYVPYRQKLLEFTSSP